MAYEKRRGKINNAKPYFDWVLDNFDNRYFVDSWKYYTDCCVGDCSDYRRIYSRIRSEEHTSELQSRFDLVCRLLLEKKKKSRAGVQGGMIGASGERDL